MHPELMQEYISHLSEVNYCLYCTESKPSANIHPAESLWFETGIRGKVCVGFYSHERVRQVLDGRFIEELSSEYPEKFNTGNPNDVIESLANKTGLKLLEEMNSGRSHEDIEKAKARWFSDYYIILTNYDRSKTVRLDLLRSIRTNRQGEIDFIGGLFHAFKHFSKGGVPISFKTEPVELPINFVNKVCEVILYEQPNSIIPQSDGNEKLVFEFLIAGKKFKMWVYLNKKCNVYFLDMLRRDS